MLGTDVSVALSVEEIRSVCLRSINGIAVTYGMTHKMSPYPRSSSASSYPLLSRMLKKSSSFVLASHSRLTISTAFTNMPRLIRRGVNLRGSPYGPKYDFASSLAAAALDGLFEHPAGVLQYRPRSVVNACSSRASIVFQQPVRGLRCFIDQRLCNTSPVYANCLRNRHRPKPNKAVPSAAIASTESHRMFRPAPLSKIPYAISM